jgi:hypothetical protein
LPLNIKIAAHVGKLKARGKKVNLVPASCFIAMGLRDTNRVLGRSFSAHGCNLSEQGLMLAPISTQWVFLHWQIVSENSNNCKALMHPMLVNNPMTFRNVEIAI